MADPTSTVNLIDVDLTAIGTLRARVMCARAKRLNRPVSSLLENEGFRFHVQQECGEVRARLGDDLIGGEALVIEIEKRKVDA